jgi:hypothetical protein
MKNSPTSLILSGGFGNVLLQIQFGRFLGSTLDKKIIFNCTLVSPQVVNDVISLIDESITQNVYRLAGLHLSHRYFLGALRHLKSWPFFVESETDEFLKPQILKNYRYITGYFQSHRYSNGPLLVQEKLEEKVSRENLLRVSKLCEQDVIVHIRFGDYLNILTKKYHGILLKSYYDKAIKSNFSGQRVIIITDDTKAAKAYFDTQNNVNLEIWSGPQFTALDDFYFMTCARNIIIGNSSFSFCAALQASRSRCTNVVAPRNWFANRSINERYRFPEDWNVV